MKWMVATLAGLAALAPAFANDGYAGLGAGGLEFGKSRSIEMVAEDLYLSRSQVRVDYRFRNTGAADETPIVAFQLPPLAPAYAELDTSLPDAVREAGDLNYFDFRASVNGRPVRLSREVRYFRLCADCEETGWGLGFLDRDDEELTETLTALDVPATYDLTAIRAWYDGLGRADQRALKSEGIFADGEAGPVPMYWISVRFYWRQAFPAGGDVQVTHTYHPVLGGSVPMIDDAITAAHCIDAGTMRAIEKRRSRIQGQSYLEYVLTTAGTWKGAIGTFRMTVDKEDADDIVSFCGEDVRKTGATTFEMVKSGYRPRQDIHILFIDLP